MQYEREIMARKIATITFFLKKSSSVNRNMYNIVQSKKAHEDLINLQQRRPMLMLYIFKWLPYNMTVN